MSRKVLGLDIRHRSITAVLAETSLQGNTIEDFEYIVYSPPSQGFEIQQKTDSVDEESELPPVVEETDRGAILLQMLDDLTGKMDVDGATCVVSFPPDDISYRNLPVPFKQKKKILQVLPFELEAVMPGPVDDLIVDFHMVDLPFSGDEGYVVSAAINKGLIDSFESCLYKGGIHPQIIIPGSLASVEHLIASRDDYSNYLFADISDGFCTLFMIADKQICCIRCFKAEEDIGKRAGLDIKRTLLGFCEKNAFDYNPEIIFISGNCVSSEVEAHLRITTGIMVEQADLLDLSEFHMANQLKPEWTPSLYDNALSLAGAGIRGFKGIKLSERYFAAGKYFQDYQSQIVSSGILLFLVLVALISNIVFDSYTVNKKIRYYDEQMIVLYKELFPEAKMLRNTFEQLKAKVEDLRGSAAFTESNAGNVKVIDMLNDISKKIPDSLDIEFSRFVLGTENLKIAGDTDTYTTVNEMKTKLESIDYFSKVDISSTSNDPSGKRVRFKLKIEF